MELLIPGLILVALMVYVSTRIKKSAASAYDVETIETEEFSITKPEGFIIPTNGDGRFMFAAYSKEFGTGDADSIRQVSAELTIHKGKTLDAVCNESTSKLVSQQRLAGDSMILETETIENGMVLETEKRLVEKKGDVFELSVTAIPETRTTQQRNIDTLLSSFEVK